MLKIYHSTELTHTFLYTVIKKIKENIYSTDIKIKRLLDYSNKRVVSMNKEFNNRFNEEINRYKKALLFHAGRCDWGTFKVNAGRLFDYCESIEASAIEKKFFKITKIIVGIILIMVIIIVKMNPEIYPRLARINELLTLIAIATCCFEVYFFYNFRMYMKGKTIYYKKRREKFIRNIEQDFKESSVQVAA
jgi:hypothetical protein